MMTVPMAFGDLAPNWIVGADLIEFLGLGFENDYFSLEQMAYDEGWSIKVDARAKEQPSAVVADLAAELGVRRWPAVAQRLGALQERLRPSLDVPDPA